MSDGESTAAASQRAPGTRDGGDFAAAGTLEPFFSASGDANVGREVNLSFPTSALPTDKSHCFSRRPPLT